jgi:solute carrier family 25, member 39/40
LAGAVAAFLTTPLDVLKTRRQVESGGGGGGGSTAGMLARIAQAEGPLALFAGVAPRLAKVAPSCAIMIASYEMGKRYFSSLPSR